ncbi:hypothetical protein HKI87_03g19950 [Chloropicon roscoffensis]|uniref:Uncharacterized protein n=1 Tax=Chloropicon roscoffensis TaxID=1461544 RepID=A0AAX4P330_9CHLO
MEDDERDPNAFPHEHVVRILRAAFGGNGDLAEEGEEEVLPAPAREEVDSLLGAFHGTDAGCSESARAPDLCTVFEEVASHAYRSIAALDGAADVDGPLFGTPRKSATAKDQLVSTMLQVYAETEHRESEEHICRECLCSPSPVVHCWRNGDIGASLLLLRRCDNTLRALLESCVMDCASGNGDEGVGSREGYLDSDHCECLISCCERAPDLAARTRLSLVYWGEDVPIHWPAESLCIYLQSHRRGVRQTCVRCLGRQDDSTNYVWPCILAII